MEGLPIDMLGFLTRIYIMLATLGSKKKILIFWGAFIELQSHSYLNGMISDICCYDWFAATCGVCTCPHVYMSACVCVCLCVLGGRSFLRRVKWVSSGL